MATTQFTLTQAAGTSTQKFTVSMWFKSMPPSTGSKGIWGCGTGTGDGLGIDYLDTAKFSLETWDGSSNPKAQTTRLFRDPSAWYHLVFSIDTTDSDADERLKIWINGVRETEFGTYTTITQDSAIPGWSGAGDTMKIGNRVLTGDSFFEGSMAHVHIIDGTIYDASAFGETDATSGIWVPNNSPSVTYGTNGGFYKFASGALTTDSSGESNTLTEVGSPTTTKDTPNNNFATMNPLENYWQNSTFSNGNNTLVTDSGGSDYTPNLSTVGLSTGKWYMEMKLITFSDASGAAVGIVSNQPVYVDRYIGVMADDWGYYSNGNYKTNNSNTAYGDTYAAGDIIGIALDLTNNKLYFSKNGTWQNSGVPTSGATGTGAISITAPASTPMGEYFFGASYYATGNMTYNTNFGNGYFGTTLISSPEADDAGIGAFAYDVPAGYYAICTNNLGDQS